MGWGLSAFPMTQAALFALTDDIAVWTRKGLFATDAELTTLFEKAYRGEKLSRGSDALPAAVYCSMGE